MGLDWLPGPKPRAGHDEEFRRLQQALARRFCWARSRKQARLDALTIDPAETLGAPLVGTDAAATDWARAAFDRRADRDLDMDGWLAALAGLRVLDLVRPCDGLPRYSNGGPGQYIGEESFRAQFLHDAIAIIGEDTFEACYVEKSPAECLAFADLLERKALAFAAAHGIDPDRVQEAEDPASDAFRVDVVLSAARWCRYWGRAGHGMVPWF